MINYLSSENLEKDPEVGNVPHKSLFDTSLQDSHGLYKSQEKLKEREKCISGIYFINSLQDLEASKFGKFPWYFSSQVIAIQSPAWTLREPVTKSVHIHSSQ